MHVSVSNAKGRLTDLVRRAQAGDEIVLTRHGRPAAKLVPISHTADPADRWAIVDAIRKRASQATPGPDAAHSQDFLYDEETGLPK